MYNRWLVPLCFFNSDDICSFQHTRLINTSWISNQRYPEVKLANVRESVCKYTIFKRCHLNGEAVIFDNSWLPLIAKWPQFTRDRSPPVSDMVNSDRFQRYLTNSCVHCKVPISEWNDNPCFNCKSPCGGWNQLFLHLRYLVLSHAMYNAWRLVLVRICHQVYSQIFLFIITLFKVKLFYCLLFRIPFTLSVWNPIFHEGNPIQPWYQCSKC